MTDEGIIKSVMPDELVIDEPFEIRWYIESLIGKALSLKEQEVKEWKDKYYLGQKVFCEHQDRMEQEILEKIDELRLKYRKIGSIKEQSFAEELKKSIQSRAGVNMHASNNEEVEMVKHSPDVQSPQPTQQGGELVEGN